MHEINKKKEKYQILCHIYKKIHIYTALFIEMYVIPLN